MTRIELAPEILEDFDRLFAYQFQHAPAEVPGRIHQIVQAIEVLGQNPLIGRPVGNGKRELIIGRKARGYVALYHYVDQIDTVLVLAIRSQREAGYARDWMLAGIGIMRGAGAPRASQCFASLAGITVAAGVSPANSCAQSTLSNS